MIKQKINKFVSGLTLIVMLSSISAPVFANSIIEQDNVTNIENVTFDATIQNGHSYTADIQKGTTIDIELDVKNEGYLKSAKIVFENNNYRIVNSLADDKCEEKMQYKILKRDEKIQLVLSTDGFINSFDTYDELKVELDNNLKMLNKNVFSNFYFKKMYKNYLYNLSKYKSFDDISIIFIYN